MKKPLVSIVVATYNGEKYLRKQLDSIFSQTIQSFEVIVADDLSTDKTIEILQSYSHYENFSYSVNEKNIGFIQNFSSLIKKANGKYIAPCDQDDIWLPEKLESLLAEIDNHMLIYSNSELIDEHDEPLDLDLKGSLKKNFISGENYKAFYFNNCVAAHTMLFHSDLLQYIDDIPDKIYHDHWLAFVACRLGSIHLVDEKLVLYRRHATSVTATVTKKKGRYAFVEHLKNKVNRQSERNKEKLNKLQYFQSFNKKINKPDFDLDEIIEQFEKFNKVFFNVKLFYLLFNKHKMYFSITHRNHLSMIFKESFGRRFYKFFPMM